jgi:hypothetical protein
MAEDFKFIKGTPRWTDYTPAGALTAGAGVVIGTSVGVLHSPGVAGEEMGVAIGGGIYEGVMGATLAEHAHVDFDNTTKKLVAAAGGAYFGKVAPGNGGVDTNRRRFIHMEKPSDAT